MKDLVEKTTKLAEEAEKHAKELEANAAKLEEATKAFADEAEKVVLEAMKTGEKKRSKPEEPPNVERREGSLITRTIIKRTMRQWPWMGFGKAPEVVVEETKTKTTRGDGYEVHDSRTCQCCGGQKKVRVELGQEELKFDPDSPNAPLPMAEAARLDIEELLAQLKKQYGEGGYRTKPLSDVELLTLIAAEQRGEIARLRQDFEEHQAHGRKRRSTLWDILEIVAIAALVAVVFVLVFGR